MLFNRHAVAVAYDPQAPRPEQWHKFLQEIFNGETDQINLLQEIFGYCLTPNISLQKAFLILGSPRSGKGTITTVLRSLLARETICDPSLKSLSGTFGMQTLIGKQLAVFGDIRMGRTVDREYVTQELLKVSGGDAVSIDRKNIGAWHGVLDTKLLLISNVLPDFADDGGRWQDDSWCWRRASRFWGARTSPSRTACSPPSLAASCSGRWRESDDCSSGAVTSRTPTRCARCRGVS